MEPPLVILLGSWVKWSKLGHFFVKISMNCSSNALITVMCVRDFYEKKRLVLELEILSHMSSRMEDMLRVAFVKHSRVCFEPKFSNIRGPGDQS